MKKIRIIGILAILVIAADLVLSICNISIDRSSEGYKAGYKTGKEFSPNNPVELRVTSLTATPDSLFNTKLNRQMSYQTDQVVTIIAPPAWLFLFYPLIFLAGLAYIGGFYRLIRLLWSVSKKDVFTESNVSRLRFFAYVQAIAYLLIWIFEKLNTHYALQQVQIPGYKVIGGAEFGMDWTLIMVTILFAEIFAVGVKIKEEQDLTV